MTTTEAEASTESGDGTAPERTRQEEPGVLDFERSPDAYRHWRVELDGAVATVVLAVDPAGGLRPDYDLKLNSYDLGVDIELHDIVTRLRFEHPEVKAVVLTGGLDKVFCAGANIQMLAGATHDHKVNFCKFTNETRSAIEDATATSGQTWLCAVNGTAAGGGYELALACDEIILVDDRSSAVSLPEVPLLGVLPGTGGLTRLVDKRHVRRDLADVFATRTEGVAGAQALAWGLVDRVAPRRAFDATVAEAAEAAAAPSDRPGGPGVALPPLGRRSRPDGGVSYEHVVVSIDAALGAATIVVSAPREPQPADGPALLAAGASGWGLAAARQLDDAVLHLRFNHPTVGTWVLRTEGRAADVLAADAGLDAAGDHWLAREIVALWKRTLKRLDVSARTLVALVEPGSCFAGTLAELALAADRTLMLDGPWPDADEDRDGEDRDGDGAVATITLGTANDGWLPMANALTRLESRFYGHPEALAAARDCIGRPLDAAEATEVGLVTATPDELDWADEVRLLLEERAAFNPDALTGMEANLRFVGPETVETKIFARLSAWQNWIFLRPNASGPEGALRRFGTGSRPTYDRKRV